MLNNILSIKILNIYIAVSRVQQSYLEPTMYEQEIPVPRSLFIFKDQHIHGIVVILFLMLLCANVDFHSGPG